MSGLFFRCRLCWPWRPDVSLQLISGGLPAGDGHLMSPHPRPSPAIERSLFPTAGLAGEGRRFACRNLGYGLGGSCPGAMKASPFRAVSCGC